MAHLVPRCCHDERKAGQRHCSESGFTLAGSRAQEEAIGIDLIQHALRLREVSNAVHTALQPHTAGVTPDLSCPHWCGTWGPAVDDSVGAALCFPPFYIVLEQSCDNSQLPKFTCLPAEKKMYTANKTDTTFHTFLNSVFKYYHEKISSGLMLAFPQS